MATPAARPPSRSPASRHARSPGDVTWVSPPEIGTFGPIDRPDPRRTLRQASSSDGVKRGPARSVTHGGRRMSISESTRFCGSCGHQLDEGARFCGSCGERVHDAPAAVAPTSVPPAAAPEGPLPVDRFCTACGHPLHPDERFCGACGQAIGGAGRPSAPTAAPLLATAPPGPLPSWPPGAPGPAGAPPWPDGTGPAPVRPSPSGRGLWWLAIALVLVVVATIAVGLVLWLGRSDDPTPAVLPSATGTTAPTTTVPPTTAPTTAAPTTAPTTEAPPVFDPGPEPTTTGFFVPEEAVADWAWATGLNYQGECSSLSSTANYGFDPWCATLWEDRGGVVIYRVADFPGGDFAFWVLVGTGADGWVVNEVSEDLTGAPPF